MGAGITTESVGGHKNNVVRPTTRHSSNGVRIKTVYGDTPSVSEVAFSDITLSGIAKYGVINKQDYENGKPIGESDDGIKIDKLEFERVTVAVASCDGQSGRSGLWQWQLYEKHAKKSSFAGVSISARKAPSKCSKSSSSCELDVWTRYSQIRIGIFFNKLQN